MICRFAMELNTSVCLHIVCLVALSWASQDTFIYVGQKVLELFVVVVLHMQDS